MTRSRLAASVALAALLSSPALASEKITGSVGGFMNIGLVYQNRPGTDELGVLRDGEIHLKWKGTSDNGLTFQGRVEVEAFTAGDQIDENWAEVSGTFGAIRIGSDDDASDAHLIGYFESPSSIVGYFDSDASIFETSTGADTPMIMYTTPEFQGLTASVSWAPQVGRDGAADTSLSFGNQPKYAVGASWSGEFSGVELALGAGFLDVDNGPTSWHVGGQIGYGGFGFGVHYDEDGFDDGVGLFSTLSVGAQYETGPWTFGGGVSTALDGPDALNWGIWATYALAPGVTATLGYEGNDDDSFTGFDTTVAGWLRMGF